jgi:hypothetical protein
VAGRPLRPATRRRLGRPSPHQQADRPRAHPPPTVSENTTFHHTPCNMWSYPVLDPVSQAYPRVGGRSPTCYSPVRRSCTPKGLTARLACVKHAASVRPEPGSNSPTKTGPSKPRHHGRGRGHTEAQSSNWHNTTSPNKQARHTVEFSKDTRTPTSHRQAVSRGIVLLHIHRTPSRTRKISGVPMGVASGPGDRPPKDSFCPASR